MMIVMTTIMIAMKNLESYTWQYFSALSVSPQEGRKTWHFSFSSAIIILIKIMIIVMTYLVLSQTGRLCDLEKDQHMYGGVNE